MKTLFITLTAITLLSAQVMAKDVLIVQCYFKDQPSFGIFIETVPFVGAFDSVTPAQITIGGPRLYSTQVTTLNRARISTRLKSGLSYFTKLDQNSSISLTHIEWVTSGYGNADFTGVYTHGSHKNALICKEN